MKKSHLTHLLQLATDKLMEAQKEINWLNGEVESYQNSAEHFRQEALKFGQRVEQLAAELAHRPDKMESLSVLLDPNVLQKEKINAIKAVRNLTNCGLRESKDFVEAEAEKAKRRQNAQHMLWLEQHEQQQAQKNLSKAS